MTSDQCVTHSMCCTVKQYRMNRHIIDLADLVSFIHGSPGVSCSIWPHTLNWYMVRGVAVWYGWCTLLVRGGAQLAVKRQRRWPKQSSKSPPRLSVCVWTSASWFTQSPISSETHWTGLWISWLLFSYRLEWDVKSMTCSFFPRMIWGCLFNKKKIVEPTGQRTGILSVSVCDSTSWRGD